MTGKFQTKGEAAQASRATKLDQPRVQTPSRGRPQKKKDGGKSSIGEMLKNSAQDVKDEAKPTTLGAQISRSANQPRTVSGGVMRNYQLEGLYWLATLYENGLNGILADEMGLGKTIQTISFLAYLRERGTYGPFLVVAPLSTLSNWIEEFARWTPSIPVVLYHGTPAQRAELRNKTLRDEHSAKFPVVCTSYEICMNDQKFLSRHGWKFIIIVGNLLQFSGLLNLTDSAPGRGPSVEKPQLQAHQRTEAVSIGQSSAHYRNTAAEQSRRTMVPLKLSDAGGFRHLREFRD